MNKRFFLIAILISLVPYLVLFALATILFSTRYAFFESIMESVFCGNALYLIAALLIYCVLAIVFVIVCFVASIYKKWDAFQMAKMSMIIKLIQIPAYVLIFALGVLFAISIFTLPFSIGLFLLDCLSVLITGLLVVSSVINTIRQGVFSPKEVFWVIILQFIFCADVISSVVFYLKLKKIHQGKLKS